MFFKVSTHRRATLSLINFVSEVPAFYEKTEVVMYRRESSKQDIGKENSSLRTSVVSAKSWDSSSSRTSRGTLVM